jgi:hypothetical protein
MNLQSWLRRTPQPVAVIADGKRVVVPSTARKWHELTATLEAMNATRLVALDDSGVTLRATSLEDGAEVEERAKSPLATELTLMSGLLADAYRTGAETSLRAMSSAIEENTKLVKLLADRLGSIEIAWQKSLTTHARMVSELAQANAEPATEDGVLASLIPLIAANAAKGGKK